MHAKLPGFVTAAGYHGAVGVAADHIAVIGGDRLPEKPGRHRLLVLAGELVPSGGQRVEDGAIIADKRTGQTAAYLVTKTKYKDFQVYVEFWASDDANSGIYMRCQDVAAITDRSCYEANIFDTRPDPAYRTGGIVYSYQRGPVAFGPEYTNNLDVSLKGRLSDRLHLAANAYRIEWRDQQVDVGTNSLDRYIVNAGSSRLHGFELALDGTLTDTLDMIATVGVNRSEYLDFTSPMGDFSGNEFPMSPRHTAATAMLLAGSPLTAMRDLPMRLLFRATRIYLSVLTSACVPEHLQPHLFRIQRGALQQVQLIQHKDLRRGGGVDRVRG